MKSAFIFVVYFLAVESCIVHAQDSLSIEKKEQITKPDTMRGKKFKSVILNTKTSLSKAFYITPTTKKDIPHIAFVRSLILPGWGQITNKQYIKLPLVYAGAAAGGYFLYDNNKKYQKYRDIIIDMDAKQETEREIDGRGPFSITTITSAASQYRRWKEGTVIAISVGWLLFAIEANVAAHLKSFDVSDDISLKLKPTLFNIPNSYAAGLKLDINFK